MSDKEVKDELPKLNDLHPPRRNGKALDVTSAILLPGRRLFLQEFLNMVFFMVFTFPPNANLLPMLYLFCFFTIEWE